MKKFKNPEFVIDFCVVEDVISTSIIPEETQDPNFSGGTGRD